MNYTLKVAHIRKETEDTVTLCFKQPGLKKVKYIPGQYLTLIFRINGRRYIRPYSFSSCPIVDQYLEVTVKRVINGVVSNHIYDQVKEGDSIEVMPPMGDFTYINNRSFKSVYLWAAGSGITPLISMAKHILNFESDVSVYLIYGNSNFEQTIFLEKILDLQRDYSERFNLSLFHTKQVIDTQNATVIQGRIDKQKALHILNDNPEADRSLHYICGPAGLKSSVKDALYSFGIKEENVFSEDFELVKDPKDFEEIVSRIIRLNFQGNDHTVEVVKGKSILEAALDANIELPYSCQTGNCSTCKGILINGSIKTIGLSHERNDLLKDEYLLCCTHPLTENVYIELK